MKTFLALLTTAILASCAGSSSSGVKPYTRNTCIVTGNKLGSMGAPITKVHGSQEVKFCCKPCVAKFEKNPQRYLAEL